MNLLFVHETEYIDKMVFEYQIIPEILASRGHNVYVVDYPTNWSKTNPTGFVLKQTEFLDNVRRANKIKGVTLIRPGFVRIPVLSRLSAFFSYYFLLKDIIQRFKIDQIILFSAPTNGLQTLWLAKKYHIPLYFRLLDVLHQLVPNKALRFPTAIVERFIYRNVDRIYAITPRLREYAIQMGAKPNTCFYLPSGSDIDLFYSQPKDEHLLEHYSLNKADLVMLFAGTLYNFSGLDKIITAIPHYLKEIPNLKLLIIGSGEQQEMLEELIKRLKLVNTVIMTGFIDYQELPKYINLGDICINPFEINKTTNLIFPGKIYQYLACGKPVIATKLQGMLDIFPEGDTNSNIFYFDQIEDFFSNVKRVGKIQKKDPNPSLQEIAFRLEREFCRH